MANEKLTQQTPTTTANSTDIIHVVNDPGGTPVSRKITKENFLKGCVALDKSSSIIGEPAEAGVGNLSTVGSSITVTLPATDYEGIKEGATLVANSLTRYVLSKDGSNQVTVDTAVDWSAGYVFTRQNPITQFVESDGTIAGWIRADSTAYFAGEIINVSPSYNDIGIPGQQDFGVGLCPTHLLPSDMALLSGTETTGHNNYGNYQFQDGSIVCWIPAHWIKIGTGSNGLDANVFSVLKYSSFNSEAEANAAGYFLPRCFKDGGDIKPGYFVDKYQCSKNAWGAGYIASSIKNGNPVSTHVDHNPISDLTACAGNYYYEALNAAKARDGADGAVAANPQWFCCSRFVYVNLAMLAMAHGQAAAGSTYCAWYDATGATNYPKGCNNNALGDTDDGAVSYTSDGYSNCGQTGSGTPFAKTTHNGQNCGVADLNGNMYEISIGATCIAASKSIEDISRANPANIQITGHGYSTGDLAMLSGIDVGDWAGLDDKIYKITVVDVNNFTLDGVDTSSFSTAYVQGTNDGSITVGSFYQTSEDTAMKDFTSGNTLSTDHWGATGVAAMMEEFIPVFETGYPNNGFGQRMGSGANQVIGEATSGNEYKLAAVGMPKNIDGIDTTGTNLFGKDDFYQYIRNELCVRSSLGWSSALSAGVWGSAWHNARAVSSYFVGFRCACYPV